MQPSTNSIWALVAGLAVGFSVGREWPRHGTEAPSATSDKATAALEGGKPGSVPEIPSSWVKETEFNAADQFTGLSPMQRYNALKALNETPCDCGCPHGSVAK